MKLCCVWQISWRNVAKRDLTSWKGSAICRNVFLRRIFVVAMSRSVISFCGRLPQSSEQASYAVDLLSQSGKYPSYGVGKTSEHREIKSPMWERPRSFEKSNPQCGKTIFGKERTCGSWQRVIFSKERISRSSVLSSRSYY